MNNIYIKNLGIHIGSFDKNDLKNKIDKKILSDYQKKYPQYKYINTKMIKENGIEKLSIYICNIYDLKI